jgi:hypothetical protein
MTGRLPAPSDVGIISAIIGWSVAAGLEAARRLIELPPTTTAVESTETVTAWPAASDNVTTFQRIQRIYLEG